jgi:hypothetical protein
MTAFLREDSVFLILKSTKKSREGFIGLIEISFPLLRKKIGRRPKTDRKSGNEKNPKGLFSIRNRIKKNRTKKGRNTKFSKVTIIIDKLK